MDVYWEWHYKANIKISVIIIVLTLRIIIREPKHMPHYLLSFVVKRLVRCCLLHCVCAVQCSGVRYTMHIFINVCSLY